MELAAARHGCKVCGKSFPCGRSLGGHMRSHLSLSEAAAEADVDEEVKHDSASFNRSSSNGVVGYGLREQPRKTRRLSDFADEEEEEDYCGDGDRDGEHKACRQCGKLFGSWRSLFGHMRSHASGGRDRDEEEEEFVPEEAEAEEVELMEAPVLAPAAVAVLAAAPRRRRRTRTMRVAAPAPVLPPVMSGFEKEQEDVALCLLMLSRDTGLWSSPIKGEEPFFEKESNRKNETKKQACLPKNSYAYNSDEDSALLEYGGGRIKTGSGVAKRRKRSSPKQQQCQAAAPKRTRYECPWCGKVFSSYQALGGHRASHKRINTSCSAPKAAVAPVPAPEPSAETHTSHSTLSPSASPDSVAISIGGGDTVSGKAKASTATVEKFECPICFKVFASGQALCAHKRSHLPADDGDLYDAGADQEEQHIPAATGFFDLNFPPAPAGEA